jgi:hypothetical protein
MRRLAIFFLLALAVGLSVPAAAQQPVSKEDALLAAIRKGDAAAVKELIARGANVNHKFRYDRMPLSFACDRGNVEIVKLLLDAGADVNARDTFYNASALVWAQQKNHTEILKLLMARGAAGKEGVLVSAARAGNVEMLQAVLDSGGLKAETLTEALGAAERAKQEQTAALLRAAGAISPPKPDFKVDQAILAKYAGTYRSDVQGAPELRFALQDGKLVGGATGQNPISLGAFDLLRFTVIETSGINITFRMDGDKCTGLHLKQGTFEAEYKRVEEKQP